MRQFDAGRSYRADLNVRRFQRLSELLFTHGSYPNGILWPLVAARRSGKTWALKAMENEVIRFHDRKSVTFSNLLNRNVFELSKLKKKHILLDEPGGILKDNLQEFLDVVGQLRRKECKVVLAVSPAEWERIRSRQCSTGGRVDDDDLHYLDPLDDAEIRNLGVHRASWAGPIVERLPDAWKTHPFLLELALEVAEKDERIRDDIEGILRVAIEQSNVDEHRYAERLFSEGLNEDQRQIVRHAAQKTMGNPGQVDRRAVLCRCGILRQTSSGYEVLDPILNDYLPRPFRIHHVSDLHVGEHTAGTVGVQSKGSFNLVFKEGVGDKPVRDAYLDHLRTLQDHHRPDVVVISGDLAEKGDADLYRNVSNWIAQLETILSGFQPVHPELTPRSGQPALPRVLMVGGNHDVDWRQVIGPEGARKRHLPLATAFPSYSRPRLEEPPTSRPLAYVSYGDEIGVEFLLLGSSEFGGQRLDDPVWNRIQEMLEDMRKDAIVQDSDEMQKRLDQLSRIDPGLVHEEDLHRARMHPWRQPARIAILHHPVSPLPAIEVNDYTGLLNAGKVKNLLMEKRFSLVLHGHMHMGWFAIEQWPGDYPDWKLHIAAAPTLGSSETQHALGYNVIEIAREGTKRFVITVTRVEHDSGGGWRESETMGPIHIQAEGPGQEPRLGW